MQIHSLAMFLKKYSAHYILGKTSDIHEYFTFILCHKNKLYAFLLYPTFVSRTAISF